MAPLRTIAAVALAMTGLVGPAAAQETMRVRATVERVEPAALYVKSRDGADLRIALPDKPVFTAIVRASLADIRPGTFVGATGVPGEGGDLKAVEVHIFPEAMRGTGEGHRPWDLQPQSTMTNANVDSVVAGVDGRTLTLRYPGGEKKLVVTPQTAIVTYAPGDRAEVKPGTRIFIAAARKEPDGSLQAARISYGKDGLTPPM